MGGGGGANIPEAPPPHYHSSGRDSPTYGGGGMYPGTSQNDLDYLKRDIIMGLRSEIREIAREMSRQQTEAPAGGRGLSLDPSTLVPPMNSELYQTHLYTQL